jgi:hypothetical protein
MRWSFQQKVAPVLPARFDQQDRMLRTTQELRYGSGRPNDCLTGILSLGRHKHDSRFEIWWQAGRASTTYRYPMAALEFESLPGLTQARILGPLWRGPSNPAIAGTATPRTREMNRGLNRVVGTQHDPQMGPYGGKSGGRSCNR